MSDRNGMRADVVAATDLNDKPFNCRRDRLPDLCPRCHHNQQPVPLSWNLIPQVNELHGVFRCTNSRCERVFIAEYELDRGSGNHFLRHLSPNEVEPPHVPTEVAKVSPMYVEIVTQVQTAIVFKLDQLVGIGLRKALEFLVKDYAILRQPTKEAEIKKVFLATVIEDYIDDSTVKELAKRATWLGNDETHYERRWEAMDIEDLKVLVELTVSAINNKIVGEKRIASMPDPKKKGHKPA
jgi:hypothetical protein